MSEQITYAGSDAPVRVERWPSEIPLLVAVSIAAVLIWVLLTATMIGLIYAVFIGLFLFVSHLGFVAYLRGSAVRLGPDQFPELHARVADLSRRIGLRKEPEAYIMQAGGALNALATGFLRSRMVVLYSDLLEACGDNEPARDMIIGHELGHIRAGHLVLRWVLFPGLVVPFLGTAYSRAREYTCDRYGAAVCGDLRRGLAGLGILAAGAVHGRRVNLRALANQREQLNTGWMTVGKWLGTHPPLSERIVALDPTLVEGKMRSEVGLARALLGMAVAGLAVTGLLAFVIRVVMPTFQQAFAEPSRQASPMKGNPGDEVMYDMNMIVRLAMAYRMTAGSFPADPKALKHAWELNHPRDPFPLDPYDGKPYGYAVRDDHVLLWSSGPDRRSGTADDIQLDSKDVDF